MTISEKSLTDNISELIEKGQKSSVVQEFRFIEKYENEFIFFFKPECFNSKSTEGRNEIIKMVLSKFDAHKCNISGIAYLTGEKISELEVMDKHYGYINKLSKTSSTLFSKDEIQVFGKALEVNNTNQIILMGGHEFMAAYSEFNPQSLDDFWKTKKSIKIRSGLYIQKYDYDNKEFIIINGFHPLQLYHFTRPDHRMIVMLVQSNQDWKILKDDLSGDTFPERANIGSIRADILANKEFYQVDDVSIANNFIHLSAGPFEGLFEIQNFIGGILGKSFNFDETSMVNKLLKEGFAKEEILRMLTNPNIELNQKKTDLFTVTENMNTSNAIDFSKSLVNNLDV